MRLQLAEAVERSATHARHPPARRTNHAALRVDHPFAADWPSLLGVPRTTLPAPGPGPGPARLRPLRTLHLLQQRLRAQLRPLLRVPHRDAVWSAAERARTRSWRRGYCWYPLPPLLKALAPRMLVRVSPRMTAKGRPYAPAAIHAMREEDLRAWRADHSWGGDCRPAASPSPAAPLQGSCLASSRTVGPACCSGSDPPLASAPPGCLWTCYDQVPCKLIPILAFSTAVSKPPTSRRFSC